MAIHTCMHAGYMQYEIPEGYSAARLVLGHSYGGSCQGYVTVYHADGSQTGQFTHEAGETFDPERIEFQCVAGDILEVVETNTCIMDLYSLDMLPTSC